MNKLIKDTLKSLNVPVSFQVYKGSKTPYITFFSYNDKGELYADDTEVISGYYFQLDIFSKSNYKELVKNVEKLMKNAGFIKKASGPEGYEKETDLYHKPLRFFFYEENNNEEEI